MDDQPERWNDRFDDTLLRAALAESAKSMKPTGSTRRGWFKRIDLGERVGYVVSKHLATIPDSSLAKTIDIVKRWASIGT